MWTRTRTYSGMLAAAAALLAAAAPLHAAEIASRPCVAVSTAEVSRLVDRWQAAVAAGQPDAIADLYADDAALTSSMSERPRIGRAAIRAYFAEFAARHPVPIFTQRAAKPGCGTASESGTAMFRVTGKRKGTRMFLGGTYATELAHRDGRWLIARQSLTLLPVPNRRIALGR